MPPSNKKVLEAKNRPKKAEGAPSIYTEELGDRICELIASHGCGYNQIRKKFPELPDRSTINLWVLKIDSFSDKYFKAKQKQADISIEELDDLLPESLHYYVDEKGNQRIDPPSVALAVARANNRKWVASRVLPKLYGDRFEVERKTEENEKLKIEIQLLREELDKKNKRDY